MAQNKWRKRLTVFFLSLGVAIALVIYFIKFEVANLPEGDQVLNAENLPAPSHDLWGHSFNPEEAAEVLNSENRQTLSPEFGAVPITNETLRVGREAFYKETFGNELFFTDVMGLIDGPLNRWQFTKALLKLAGRGTTNLKVRLAEEVRIGDKVFHKGEEIDTGLDVPKGSMLPLGIAVSYNRGKIRAGITCAACHSTVDPSTLKVIEGGANSDLNAGLLLALATNSATYFAHADRQVLERYAGDLSGAPAQLPAIEKFERAVDLVFASWAPGNFDSTIDLVANPAQIPDSFTLGERSFGWTGFAMAGPFKGLSSFSNNGHAQNIDSVTQYPMAQALLDISPETYLVLSMRNSPVEKYRYPTDRAPTAKAFVDGIKSEEWSAGVNETIPSPIYPKLSLVAPDGVFVSSPDHKFWEQTNAMAAWQNTLRPPDAPIEFEIEKIARGQQVFTDAKCVRCHEGPFLAGPVIPVAEVGTEPSRARAHSKTESIFSWNAMVYPFSASVPPKDAPPLQVPLDEIDPQQVRLAWGHRNTGGGYKVPALRGLYWSAPYLHDGGVAADREAEQRSPASVKSTAPASISAADPTASLRALIDRDLRARAISVHESVPERRMTRLSGKGHNFWVDTNDGYSREDQDALIQYLLSIR